MSIQLKGSLTSQISSNYILKDRQIGVEKPGTKNTSSSPFKFKIGDGSTKWSNLPYATYTTTEVDSKVSAAETNAKSASLPLSGGTITGDLKLKGSTNYGNKLSFGDGDYVYLYEEQDDILTIKAKEIKLLTTNTNSTGGGLTLNGSVIGGSTISTPVSIANGGTGATTASGALTNLGAASSSHTHSGYLSTTGTAASATKLATSRSIQTNLGSTSSASFNGTADITPGITGTLSVAHGGTGVTTIAALKTALSMPSSFADGSIYTDSGVNTSESSKKLAITKNSYNTSYHLYFDATLKSVSSVLHPNGQTCYLGYENSPFQTLCLSTTTVANQPNGVAWVYSGSDSTSYPVQIQGSGTSKTTGKLTVTLGTSGRYFEFNDEGFYARPTNLRSLGTSSYKWTSVYATTGTIQTSDRSSKHAIHYLSDANTSLTDASQAEIASTPIVGLEDVIEFINELNPATFIYNTADSDENLDPAARQIGIIADDVENTKLFPYIGARFSWEETPEEQDEDGNVIREYQPAGSSLAVKPIPLAVTALTACKYLLQQVESLQEQIDTLSK